MGDFPVWFGQVGKAGGEVQVSMISRPNEFILMYSCQLISWEQVVLCCGARYLAGDSYFKSAKLVGEFC